MSTRRYGNFDSSNSNALLQFLSGPNLSHTPLAHSLTPYTHLACSILTHTHTHTNTHTCTHTPLTHSLTPHINLTCLFLTCTNIPLAHCTLAHSKGHVCTSHMINPHTHLLLTLNFTCAPTSGSLSQNQISHATPPCAPAGAPSVAGPNTTK